MGQRPGPAQGEGIKGEMVLDEALGSGDVAIGSTQGCPFSYCAARESGILRRLLLAAPRGQGLRLC